MKQQQGPGYMNILNKYEITKRPYILAHLE